MTKNEKIRFAAAALISLFSLGFAVYFLTVGIASLGFEMGGADSGFAFAAQLALAFGLLFFQFVGIVAACGLALGAFLAYSLKNHGHKSIKIISCVMVAVDIIVAAAVVVTDVLMIRF